MSGFGVHRVVYPPYPNPGRVENGVWTLVVGWHCNTSQRLPRERPIVVACLGDDDTVRYYIHQLNRDGETLDEHLQFIPPRFYHPVTLCTSYGYCPQVPERDIRPIDYFRYFRSREEWAPEVRRLLELASLNPAAAQLLYPNLFVRAEAMTLADPARITQHLGLDPIDA